MEIINRIGKYKASGREWYTRDPSTVNWLTVHHTADPVNGTDDQILDREAAVHINQGWPGLSYHFFIPKSGKIYQINKIEEVTWHDAINWDSVGVCLHGYFHPSYNQQPTEAQMKALRYILDQLSTKHPEFPADQSNVVGHRERSSTACPGDNLIGTVVDYRNKLGKVSWGNYETSQPTPTPINLNWSDTQKKQVVDLVQKGGGNVEKWKIRQILNIPYLP